MEKTYFIKYLFATETEEKKLKKKKKEKTKYFLRLFFIENFLEFFSVKCTKNLSLI